MTSIPDRLFFPAQRMAGVATLALLVGGCAAPSAEHEAGPGAYTLSDLNEQLVMATAWMQSSAEYRALSHQAFNVARDQLDEALARHGNDDRPLAVVVDADETVIDNTAFEAYLVDHDAAYNSELWHQWMAAREAKALPGAVEFLDYAVSQGVDVYYITNRDADALEATRDNMAALGFPQLEGEHLMLRTDSSDKQARRDRVLADHEVALYMGDNLADFSSVYDSDVPAERRARVAEQSEQFGRRFVMLPNPTYGDWEGAIYGGDWGASPAEKSAARKAVLRSWQPDASATP
ncbi:5'-nucleotidase, lipoprotein e(P4) family [Halomonas sp. HP20-15]|uniref:5'-nucleotidase, lipoprotein e(P4) family n=1 Tax=Halomonas sp. HP20-15 TaxID=3085901 RepID=UPI002981BB35|nr:5'-nucleotidase, lipoprotein e(P4) family [Halomonas sp. HP20-15]MDW5376290.1 5'-nucleotidase, lipoprotein e(P4) family [Halomonas sp. HP20-15]